MPVFNLTALSLAALALSPAGLLLSCGVNSAPGTARSEPALVSARTDGAAPVLCINEIMPENKAALILDDGSHPDWVELFNPTAAAVSLDGWTISDDRAQPDQHALSAALEVPAGGTLLLYADEAVDEGPEHLDFKLASTGEEVALFDPSGDGTVVAFGMVYDDFSVSRSDDCCTGEGCLEHVFLGSPGLANHVVLTEDVELVAAGSTWAYRDDGEPADGDWMMPTYDDSRWSSGPAPLGYGDGQTTVVSYGDNASSKYITTWFRLSFDPADAGLSDVADVLGLQLGLMRDDGAQVWLNGESVARSNLPDGEVAADTLASVSVGDADERAFFAYRLKATALTDGTNVLAVEVHQATVTSSDLSLDLQLVATREVAMR